MSSVRVGSASRRRTILETRTVRVGGTTVLRSLLAMVLISLAACHTAILSPVGPVGEGNRIVLLDSLAIMLAIVVPTIVAARICSTRLSR
jgi:hypothetical protein